TPSGGTEGGERQVRPHSFRDDLARADRPPRPGMGESVRGLWHHHLDMRGWAAATGLAPDLPPRRNHRRGSAPTRRHGRAWKDVDDPAGGGRRPPGPSHPAEVVAEPAAGIPPPARVAWGGRPEVGVAVSGAVVVGAAHGGG